MRVEPVQVGQDSKALTERVTACLTDAAHLPMLTDEPIDLPEGDPFPNLASNYTEVRIPDALLDTCQPFAPAWVGPLHAEGCPR